MSKLFRSRMPHGGAGRWGTSVVELLVALALLGTVALGVGQLTVRTKEGLRNRELSSRLNWELKNARETIGAWPVSEITVEKIQQMPISLSLASQLEDLGWEASIEAISQPVDALQVTLTLRCRIDEQAARPVSLTFWVDASQESPAP